MKKIFFLAFGLICSTLLYGQNTTVTNNNTITIQGNVYYFRPSTTPSSPPPTQSSDFLGSGHWYGEDAARAWASIADWVFDRCLLATPAIVGERNERVYISAVHVFRRGDRDFNTFSYPSISNYPADLIVRYGYVSGLKDKDKQVRIDYWVVRTGTQMADGRRETRWFGF